MSLSALGAHRSNEQEAVLDDCCRQVWMRPSAPRASGDVGAIYMAAQVHARRRALHLRERVMSVLARLTNWDLVETNRDCALYASGVATGSFISSVFWLIFYLLSSI